MIKKKEKYIIPLILIICISLINTTVVASENKIDPRDKNNIVIVENPSDSGIKRLYNKFKNTLKLIGDNLSGTYYEDFDFKKYIINGQGVTKEEINENPNKLKELLKSRENLGLEGIEVFVGEGQRHTLVDYVSLLNREIRDRVISRNTVWTKEKGPYYVTGKLTIEKGNTLTIEEGTEVYFKKTPIKNENGLIVVEGSLIVNGTEANNVKFTPYDETASKGSWSGIYVDKTGSVDINYTNIDKAGFWSGAAIYSEGNVIVRNSSITNTSGNGITAFNDISVINSIIDNNEKIGIDIYAKDKSVNVVLKDNIISNNNIAARTVYRNGYSEVYEASNNSFENNNLNAMRLYGDISGDTDLDKLGDNAPYSIPAKTVTLDNREKLVINEGANVNLNNGAIKFERSDFSNFKARIEINGVLNLAGTSDDKIYITSELDDEVYGDTTLDGDKTSPKDEEYEALLVSETGVLNINHTDIRYGGANIEGKSGIVNYGGVTIDNSIIRNSYNGVYSKGDLSINNSEIYDLKGYALYIYPDKDAIDLSINNNIFKGFNNYFSKIYIKNSGISNFKTKDNKLIESEKRGIELIADIALDTEIAPIVDNVPYVVLNRSFVNYKKDDLYVDNNTTLNLKAGTIIKMDNKRYGYKTNILVNGQINTYGTEEDRVYITSIEDDTIGGDTSLNGNTTGSAGNWDGIDITNNGVNNINGAVISFAGNNASPYALKSNGELIINNSSIENNLGTGIYSTKNTSLINTNIKNNSEVGVNVNPTGDNKLVIEDSSFENNGQEAAIVQLTSNTDCLVVKNNSSNNNKINGLLIKGDLINEDLVLDNQGSTFPYVINDVVTINEGNTVKLLSDSIIKFKENAGLIAHGNLEVIGKKSNMVNITSIKDDTIGGDTNNDGLLTSPYIGDYKGVSIRVTSKSNINGLKIAYGNTSRNSIVDVHSDINVNDSVFTNGTNGISSYNGINLTNNNFNDITNNAFRSSINLNEEEMKIGKSFVVTNNNFDNIGDYIGYIHHSANYSDFKMNSNTVKNSYKNGVHINSILAEQDMTFTTFSDNTPYVVDSIHLNGKNTLNIVPNVVFKMNDNGNIYSNGAVNIKGTKGNRVTITSVHDDTVLGDTENNGYEVINKGAWHMVSINYKSSIEYCDINYGGIESTGELNVKNSSFSNNDRYAIDITAPITIENTKFKDNDDYAISSVEYIVVSSSTFDNNEGAAIVKGNINNKLNVNISSTTFKDQYTALDIYGECNGGIITGSNNIEQSGKTISNKINIVTNGVLDINKIVPNDVYLIENSLKVNSSGTLNINEGNIFKMAEEADFIVEGILNCNGTANNKVILSSTNDKKKWKGLNIKVGGTVEVKNSKDINSIKNFNFDEINTIKAFSTNKNLLVSGENSSLYVRGNEVILYNSNTKSERSIYKGSVINQLISNGNFIGILDGNYKVVVYNMLNDKKIIFDNSAKYMIESISIDKDKILCYSLGKDFTVYNISTSNVEKAGSLKEYVDNSFKPVLYLNNILYKSSEGIYKRYNYVDDETTTMISRYNNLSDSRKYGNNIVFTGGAATEDNGKLLVFNYEKGAILDRNFGNRQLLTTPSIFKDKISFAANVDDRSNLYLLDSNGVDTINEKIISSGYAYENSVANNNLISFIEDEINYNVSIKPSNYESTFYNPSNSYNQGYSRDYALSDNFKVGVGLGAETIGVDGPDITLSRGKESTGKIIIEKDSNGEDTLIGFERENINSVEGEIDLGVKIGAPYTLKDNLSGGLVLEGSRKNSVLGKDTYYFGINGHDSYANIAALMAGAIFSEQHVLTPLQLPVRILERLASHNVMKQKDSLQKYEQVTGVGTSLGVKAGTEVSVDTIESIAQPWAGLISKFDSEAMVNYGISGDKSGESHYVSIDFAKKGSIKYGAEIDYIKSLTQNIIENKLPKSFYVLNASEGINIKLTVNWSENYCEIMTYDYAESDENITKRYYYRIYGEEFTKFASKVEYIGQMKASNLNSINISSTFGPDGIIGQIIKALSEVKVEYKIVGERKLVEGNINASISDDVELDVEIEMGNTRKLPIKLGLDIGGGYKESCDVVLDEGIIQNGKVLSESPGVAFLPEDPDGLIEVVKNMAIGFVKQINPYKSDFSQGIASYNGKNHNIEIEDNGARLSKAIFYDLPLSFGGENGDDKNIDDGCTLISNGVYMRLVDTYGKDSNGSSSTILNMYTNKYNADQIYNYSLFYYDEAANKWEYVDSKKEITEKGLKISTNMTRAGQYAIGTKPAPDVKLPSNGQTFKEGDLIEITSEQKIGEYTLMMEIRDYDSDNLIESNESDFSGQKKSVSWIAKGGWLGNERKKYKINIILKDICDNEYKISRYIYVKKE